MKTQLQILKALGDGNRLRIVSALLSAEELCACQIIELLAVSGATASRHLSLLLSAGIVSNRKEGRWVYYKVAQDSDNREILGWIKDFAPKSAQLKKDKNTLDTILTNSKEDICRTQKGEGCCPKK